MTRTANRRFFATVRIVLTLGLTCSGAVCADLSSYAVEQARKSSYIRNRGETITIGDRLKIAFFQDLRPGTNSDNGVFANLIKRAELTGEYVVQQDGTLYLPLIG